MLAMALLSLPLTLWAQESAGVEKPVWQQTDKTQPYYLSNRRALVGPGCVVNSMFDGVSVVSGVTGLANLVDEDLTNYATIPSVADVGTGVKPIISVKDMENNYAAGTVAGFSMKAATGSSLLTLKLAEFYQIWFYKDGVEVGRKTVTQGQDINGISLKLIQIPGSEDFSLDIVATSEKEFDEVKLIQAGVDLDVLSSIQLKYAFVGSAREFTLTHKSMEEYSQYKGATVTVEGHRSLSVIDTEIGNRKNLVDDDLTNGLVVEAIASLGSSLPATVNGSASDGSEAFKAGMEVGFVFTSTKVLDLSLAKSIVLTLYDKNKNEVGTYNVSTSVLGLDVASSSKGGFSIKADKDFSSAMILFPSALSVDLGAITVNYAFIRLAPEIASHHCPINAMASLAVCDCDNVFHLKSNPNVSVTWSVVKQPTGANVSIDSNNDVTLSVPGEYTFRATAADGCYEETTIKYGTSEVKGYDPETSGEIRLVNDNGEKYELSGKGGGLIQISSGMKNREALLTPTTRDYQYERLSIDLADNTVLAGLKSKDGSNLAGTFADRATKVGFLIASKATALSADVLNIMNIQLYKNGNKVEGGATKHWQAIDAGLIGSGQMQKVRYSIDVPAGTDFDEVVLYTSGVLSLNLEQMNIYYAYVQDASKTLPSDDILADAQIISHNGTNASIDHNNTNLYSVANVGNGLGNISNVIDGDISTGVDFPLGANLGGAKLAVNLGVTAGKGQQLVVVMDKEQVGLGVKLGEALMIKTFLNGTVQESLNSWRVLGADVIGDGGKTFAVLNPTKDFDQVQIIPLNVLGALSNIKLFALALRNDANGDGIPDAEDTNPCDRELILDEDVSLAESREFKDVRMVFHRTINKDASNRYTWNSLILPVELSRQQVEEAFGSDALVARLSRVEDNWIYFVEQDKGAINKNFPYIIKVSREPDLGADAEYESLEGTIVKGPIYFASGVNYTKPENNTITVDGDDPVKNVTHTGSYDTKVAVPVGSYMLNKGNMVHTAVEHKVKGYRAWLTTSAMDPATGSEAKAFDLRVVSQEGETTGIKTVDEAAAGSACSGVWNMNGQRVDGSAQRKGVFIVNGKKVLF